MCPQLPLPSKQGCGAKEEKQVIAIKEITDGKDAQLVLFEVKQFKKIRTNIRNMSSLTRSTRMSSAPDSLLPSISSSGFHGCAHTSSDGAAVLP